MKKDLKCYYNWAPLDEKQFYSAVREFVDNGFRKFVITDPLLRQMIDSNDRIKLVKKICADMEVEFSAVHGLFGKWQGDLNCTNKERWEPMYEDHIKGMKIAAEFGKAVCGETKVDILVVPLVTIGIGVALSAWWAPACWCRARWG